MALGPVSDIPAHDSGSEQDGLWDLSSFHVPLFECKHLALLLGAHSVLVWAACPSAGHGEQDTFHDWFQLMWKEAVSLEGTSDHKLEGSPLAPILHSDITTIFFWQLSSLWKGTKFSCERQVVRAAPFLSFSSSIWGSRMKNSYCCKCLHGVVCACGMG